MAAFRPHYLVPGHTMPIRGEAAAVAALEDYSAAIRSVYEQTVEGINEGKSPDQIAHDPCRHRRSARHVVQLQRECVSGPESVGHPRRDLPDGVILPGGTEVHDRVDRRRIEVALGETRLRGTHAHVRDVLVGTGDVLAPEAEPIDHDIDRDA